jgi:hypothetical protein
MGGVTYGDSTGRLRTGVVNLRHAITTDRAELAGNQRRWLGHPRHRGETPRAVACGVPTVAPAARIGQIGKLLYTHRF